MKIYICVFFCRHKLFGYRTLTKLLCVTNVCFVHSIMLNHVYMIHLVCGVFFGFVHVSTFCMFDIHSCLVITCGMGQFVLGALTF